MLSSLQHWLEGTAPFKHRRRANKRRMTNRRRLLQQLEHRVVLSAVPIAVADPWYDTAQNTSLVVDSSDVTLLDNDWDPEDAAITATLVSSPANGSVSSFGSDGTFTYVPNTNFSGFDSFTYKVSDGTVDSEPVEVSIAVGSTFGVRTNVEELPQHQLMLAGGVELAEPLTPGVSLIYQSNTIPEPIVAVDTSLLSSSAVPNDIDARLTFNSVAGTTYNYDTTGLSAGDGLRVALRADATSLATGRYDYSLDLTANYSSSSDSSSYTGHQHVVNRSGSAHAFGRGWQLAGLDSLEVDANGALWVMSNGASLWFEDDGSGGFYGAEGDASYSTLIENVDNSFTITTKSGHEINFDSSGLLTSRVDRNGNTVSYSYSGGLLNKITDPFARETTFSYTNGQLTSVTDFASRTATLAYDGSGRLTSITQPDPDGAGTLAAPVTSLQYDATSHRLTKRTDAISQETSFSYGSHGRLTTITHPDLNDTELVSLQTIGLPSGASGNSLAEPDPKGTLTDERNFDSHFRTDRFGNVVYWEDQLDHVTLTERNAIGQLIRSTGADPDDSGPLASPITELGYDASGNLIYQENPDATTKTWTITSSFNQIASATDELGRTRSFQYDISGNLTTATDAAGFATTHSYNSNGLVLSTTTPDPDDTGPLSASTTSYAYDTVGRLVTVTNPDSSTRQFAYDAADNVITDTNELGDDATFTYDTLDRLTSVTDREGATMSHVYDAIGQLTKTTDVLGGVTDYEYNARGLQTKVTRPDPDGAGPLTRPETEAEFDAAGNLTSFVTPETGSSSSPQPVTHTYDAAGRRTQTTGPLAGMQTNFTYDNLGRLTDESEYQHIAKSFEYDVFGRMTSQSAGESVDPDPPTTSYEYDDAGQLVKITDPRGYSTEYKYEDRGLLRRVTLPDPDGAGSMLAQSTTYDYDNAGRLTHEYGVFTRTTQYEYDSRDRLTKLTLPDPNDQGASYSPVYTLTYDAAGNQLTLTDPLGNITTQAFDKNGRVTTITNPDPDGAGPQSAPVDTYAYDNAGNVTSVTDPNGGVTSLEYDALGRQTKLTNPDPDGAGPLAAPVTNYAYNDSGLLASQTDPAGRTTTFQYDAIGRRNGVTDDDGNQTTYIIDNFDNITSVTAPDPDGTGPLTAAVTSYQYDVFDRVTQFTDPESGKTYFTYDDAGNLLTLKDPVNNITSFAYDGMGRLTIETNDLGKTRSYEYELAGNLARKTDRNGRVTQYFHDNLERLTAEKWYENGSPTPSLSVTVDTEGGEVNEIQRVGYDSYSVSGGTFTLTFDSETTSALAYNATAAQVQSALESLSSVGNGNVSVVKEELPQSTRWILTFQGSLAGTNVGQTTIDTSGLTGYGFVEVETTDQDGGVSDETQTINLDNATGGTFRLAFEGETTAALDYDATALEVETALENLNAVDSLTVTGAAGGPWTVTFTGNHAGLNVPSVMGDATAVTNGTLNRTLSFTYDKNNRLTAADDPDSQYAFGYDNLGRLTSVDNDGTVGVPRVILNSTFDASGNRTELAATIDGTDDFVNSYVYDAMNRVTRIDQIGVTGGNTVSEKRVDFAYNNDSRYDSIVRYNDTGGAAADEIATSTYSYDSLGRLTGLDYEQGGTDLFTPYSWTYDDLSRITQFVGADGTTDYEYDKTDQLTDADHDYQTDESYSYDANGNRTNAGYMTGDDNRLTNDGTYSYEYDDEGNRTKRTSFMTYEETTYDWDYRNRLTKVTDKDGYGTTTQVVEYTYDIFDRRIAKSVDTTAPFDIADAAIERYVYDDVNGTNSVDGGNVVLDFVDPDGSGTAPIELERRQLFGNVVDQILAQENVDESISSIDRVYWMLNDHLDSVRDIAKNDGTLGEHYEYDAFGNVIQGDTSKTRYLYTGRELDSDTGLQHNRARWFDQDVGRWINQDPIGFAAGDSNLYRYIGNGPTNAIDPSGLVRHYQGNKKVGKQSIDTVGYIDEHNILVWHLYEGESGSVTVEIGGHLDEGFFWNSVTPSVNVGGNVGSSILEDISTGLWGFISPIDPVTFVETIGAAQDAMHQGTLNQQAQEYGTSGEQLNNYLDQILTNSSGIGGTHVHSGVGNVAEATQNAGEANFNILISGGIFGFWKPKGSGPKGVGPKGTANGVSNVFPDRPPKTVYHQGDLTSGVSGVRPLSTSTSSDLSHYHPTGQLYQFDIPADVYDQWILDGSIQTYTDYHFTTGITRSEIRIMPPASDRMNEFLVPRGGG